MIRECVGGGPLDGDFVQCEDGISISVYGGVYVPGTHFRAPVSSDGVRGDVTEVRPVLVWTPPQ